MTPFFSPLVVLQRWGSLPYVLLLRRVQFPVVRAAAVVLRRTAVVLLHMVQWVGG